MGMEETKNHVHIQNAPYRFEVTTYAPDKNSAGKGRFSVQVMAYVTGSGWDILNPTVSGNEILRGIFDAVNMYEMLGYVHVGLGSGEIKRMMENLWKP